MLPEPDTAPATRHTQRCCLQNGIVRLAAQDWQAWSVHVSTGRRLVTCSTAWLLPTRLCQHHWGSNHELHRPFSSLPTPTASLTNIKSCLQPAGHGQTSSHCTQKLVHGKPHWLMLLFLALPESHSISPFSFPAALPVCAWGSHCTRML